MDVKAYIYVQSDIYGVLCFRCAVKQIIDGKEGGFTLTLEQGSTGDGNDMRGAMFCEICEERLEDFCIA